ncbi:hypothetical protein I79_012606 [Cricetulus griseus]|uniref:Uncharacterized protein n=1 Tax=Cricetulus griseus TaxID=10029 RepID=G3HP99_CRIGR|nr:hypothetical protein I79_012606 [Cricetulus griseus]
MPPRHRKASRTDRKRAPQLPAPTSPQLLPGRAAPRLPAALTWSRSSGWEQLPHGSCASEPRDVPRQPRLSGVRGYRAALARAPGRARSQDSAKFLGNAGMRLERAAGAARHLVVKWDQCSAESALLKGCD